MNYEIIERRSQASLEEGERAEMGKKTTGDIRFLHAATRPPRLESTTGSRGGDQPVVSRLRRVKKPRDMNVIGLTSP